jgi:hypothetical protein
MVRNGKIKSKNNTKAVAVDAFRHVSGPRRWRGINGVNFTAQKGAGGMAQKRKMVLI